MTTDDLRTRAERAAAVEYVEFSCDSPGLKKETASLRNAFVEGALWHAAQQPTREQIARAILAHFTQDKYGQWRLDPHSAADAVLALLTGDESDE